MANEENKKVNTPAANAEMTETEKLARTPNVSIATPTYNKEQIAQKIDADHTNPQKQVTDLQVTPTPPSEADQLQSIYAAKQNENRKKEDAIIANQDEERKKAQRKQRNRQIVNSIADGLSAISNIVTTAHGAPDLGVGKTLMTAKSQERYDKLYKDAEDRRKEYLKIVREGNKEDLSNWYTMQKDAMTQRIKERETKVKEAEQKRKELQEKRLQAESEAKILLLNAKASKAEQDAIIAELYASKTPEEIDLKLQEIRSKIHKNNRSGSGGSGGRGAQGYEIEYIFKEDKDGNIEYTNGGVPIKIGSRKIVGNNSSNNKNNNKGGWSAKNR